MITSFLDGVDESETFDLNTIATSLTTGLIMEWKNPTKQEFKQSDFCKEIAGLLTICKHN